MLVLTRKAHEGIWIGENVHITILGIAQGRVKIGIEAPPDVVIDREELRTSTHSHA
jgi:carbon storage regulator